MIVVYRVILYTFVLRYANADQLNLEGDDRQLAWTEAFSSCNDPIYWHQTCQIFNDCQAETCNASSVADKIINAPRYDRLQYWIYGYVLRSPVFANIGCFSLNDSVKNAFRRGIFLFEHNSAFECSMACPDDSVEHILLRGRECLCIPKIIGNQLSSHILLQEQENTSICNQPCAGNSGDFCGGPSDVDGKLLYSVFQVLQRYISTSKVGGTCAELSFNANTQFRFGYTACNSNRMYICERYIKSDQLFVDTCHNETVSWYAAQQNCHEQGSQLRSFTTSSFWADCVRNEQKFWIGNHVAEKIVWANDSLPKDALCLKLVITNSGSSFEAENCRTSLNWLCYKQQNMSSGKNGETYTKPSTQSYSSTDISTDTRQPTAAVDRSTENYPIYITAVSIVFVLGVIIATIAFCIKRRFRQKLYTSVVPAQPQIYSDLNTNPYDEITELDMPQNLDEDGYEMPRSAKITTLG